MLSKELSELIREFKGEIFTDLIRRTIYATDASVYKELPLAVSYPADANDIRKLILFAKNNGTSLIPRAAGTSLAGQVVGNGIVVDVGRYMNRILEINPEKRFAVVEPGVVLEDLNKELQGYGLFFGPETSTANRCMIGGMLGNNACGLHSLVYGSTRDHTLEVEGLLSDGSYAVFKDLTRDELETILKKDNLESSIYRNLIRLISPEPVKREILDKYPHPAITRRNTGYAIDLLLNMIPFREGGQPLNLSQLLGGSEGTLVFTTRIKLKLVPLPPPERALLCAHFSSIRESLLANLVALRNKPTAVELMDHHVLDCTSSNRDQEANRFFVQGNPTAILIIEFAENNVEELELKVNNTVKELQNEGLGYAYPIIYGNDIRKVWDLRRAGLGLLGNLPGDAKSVTVVEDTAVRVEDLPDYIEEIDHIFRQNDLTCVYHAHIGTGELHLRPVLNLKSAEDVRKFKIIAEETVKIVKKYRGSFSGEHGDGRLRGSFIKDFFGEKLYDVLKEVKGIFDPKYVFNPGKIIDTPPMDEFLRYYPGQTTPELDTYFDFSETLGFVRAIEKCNGSGDCRKSHLAGGAMCPSYQATRDERNTTRARANILREFLSQPAQGANPYNHPEVYEILDLCLSCKACKTECPSSVDMAKLKAEFLSHWYESHKIPLRTRIIAHISDINRIGSIFPSLTNLFLKPGVVSKTIAGAVGFAKNRSLPLLSGRPLSKRGPGMLLRINPTGKTVKGKVHLFVDEFTNYNDGEIGVKTLELLTGLGYEVILPSHTQSARALISKGLLKQAKRIANENIRLLSPVVSLESPLVGIEPSAILGFRDEYPDLAYPENRELALSLAANCFTIEEFLSSEADAGRIGSRDFSTEEKSILVHGHCQQKAISSTAPTLRVLSIPANYHVEEIPSGCCGMAGSFGYEAEHYELSMQVGELVLFPSIRKSPAEVIICASGTSCRHQIKDGTQRKAYHPVEVLWAALKNNITNQE